MKRSTFFAFMPLLFLLLSCSKDKIGKDSEEPDNVADFIWRTLPPGMENPEGDPARTGTPTAIKLLLPFAKIGYKNTEAAMILVFDNTGQWINSDRPLTVNLITEGTAIETQTEPGRVPTVSLQIPINSPSGIFALAGVEEGQATLSLVAEDLAFSGDVSIDVEIITPQVITANQQLFANQCQQVTFKLSDNNGKSAFFSRSKSTTLTLQAAGCGFFSDASCSQQSTSIEIAADSEMFTAYILPGSDAAFIDFSSENGLFSAQASCSGI